MAQTVIGIFDTAREADNAVEQLVFNGFTRAQIDVAAQATTDMTGSNTTMSGSSSTTASSHQNEGFGEGISRFFSSLFDSDDDVNNYSEVARRGTVVTVHTTSTQESERAAQILDQYGAVDVDEKASHYRNSFDSDTFDTTRANSVADEVTGAIPIIEEELHVGKRVVETGGVRLRSRIIERPVEESLRLRVEHVYVERNPVNRAATDADLANFQQGTVEITESAEVPVVGKEARVVEEVRLQKDVEEREETIRDTVRRTDVEVENLRSGDSTLRSDDLDDDLNRPAAL